jgi:cytochrome d ubiquinol oxidase subunit II
MFEALSYENLQIYWWIIMSVLGGFLVFLLLVQGGQTLLDKLSDNEDDKTVLVNIIGHKWEFTFTTLVVFGGAFFASFPLFYSTSFGGAYWVWYAILFAFILQAVSYEYRKKKNNFLGSKTFEGFLKFNGYVAPFLLGVAVSTFFTGSQFSIQKENIVKLNNNVEAIISQWQTPWHGLEALWTTDHLAFLQNILLGLAVLVLARLNALLYIRKMTDEPGILAKIDKSVPRHSILFLVLFLTWFIRLMIIDGFAVNPENKEVFMQAHKYFNNYIEMPLVLIILLAGLVSVLWGLYKANFQKDEKAVWWTASGTILTVMSLFFIAAFNNTAYYPSTYDLQSSLTLANSSSSKFTLISMSYVSLMVPFVLAYMVWAWRAMDAKKVDKKELEEELHKY